MKAIQRTPKARTFHCGKTVFRRVQKSGPVWARWEVLGSWGWEAIDKGTLRSKLKVL